MHGVSRAAVTQWGKLDRLIMRDAMVDVEASNALLQKYRKGGSVSALDSGKTDPARMMVAEGDSAETVAANILATSGVEWTIDEAKRIKESYLALLNQLEYDQKSGAVVLVEDVADTIGKEYALVRTRLLAIPAECAPQIQRFKTVVEVRDFLHRTIVEALEGLTRDGGNIS